jgi:hypothetical protein
MREGGEESLALALLLLGLQNAFQVERGKSTKKLLELLSLTHPATDRLLEGARDVDLMLSSIAREDEIQAAMPLTPRAPTIGISAGLRTVTKRAQEESVRFEELLGSGTDLALDGSHGTARNLGPHGDLPVTLGLQIKPYKIRWKKNSEK